MEVVQAYLRELRDLRQRYSDNPGYRLGVADWVAEELLILEEENNQS